MELSPPTRSLLEVRPEPTDRPSNVAILKASVKNQYFLAIKRKRLICVCVFVVVLSLLTIWISSLLEKLPPVLLVLAPILLMIITGILGPLCVTEIVSDKEIKMKIVQEVYGMPSTVYWLTWVVYFGLLSSSITVFMLTVIYLFSTLFEGVNIIICASVFVVGFAQHFAFVCAVAAFFDTAKSATVFCNLLDRGRLILGSVLLANSASEPLALKLLAGLFPGVNVAYAFQMILARRIGLKCNSDVCEPTTMGFSDLFKTEVCLKADDCQTMTSVGAAILLGLVDIVAFFFLAWWIDNVRQGEYGSAKPLCFCFDPAFMCPRREHGVTATEQTREADGGDEHRRSAMSIRNLRKVYGSKVVVDDMSLEMHAGEIFALLGHNGAGKTTAINCAIGLVPATSGVIKINGIDNRLQLEKARTMISVCPQDNPFYPEFTVRRHLSFFGILRGVSEHVLEERMQLALSVLGMPDKIDEFCKTLSGGQKRRLWVATALLADSPTSFLDEPTSGMDPSSRRELWGLLLRMRDAGRCVIFTTHYLDEADILANRKAVLAHGRVMAVGTSTDLKMQFGCGYHLCLELEPRASEALRSSIANFVCRHVVAAKEETVIEEEQASASADRVLVQKFSLPFNEVPNFGPLLTELEEKSVELKINDYTLEMTSLEEVFLSLGRQADADAGGGHSAGVEEVDREDNTVFNREEVSDIRCIQSVARVRFLSIVKDRGSWRATFLLPLIFVVLGFYYSSSPMITVIYPCMAFGLLTVIPAVNLIQDNDMVKTKIKHVALSQGLSVKVYWIGAFAAHYSLCLHVVVAFLVGLVWRNIPGLSGNFLPFVVILVVLYPIQVLVLAYVLSRCFKTAELALKIVPLFNLFFGTLSTMVVYLLMFIAGSSWKRWGVLLHFLFSAVNPAYSLPAMLLFRVYDTTAADMSLSDAIVSYAIVPLYLMPLCTLLWGAKLYFLDTSSYKSPPVDFREFGASFKDQDVLAEESRVAATTTNPPSDEAARYQALSHTYKTKVDGKWRETPAVRGISLGIRKGECFGLLGPNGAGKTTTLGVLTGEIRPPTKGDVTILGHDLSTASGLTSAYHLLGVCPQVDPLWPNISGREHLLFYATVKGVRETDLKTAVDKLLRRLGFDTTDADKPTKEYSGGMKRKLSLGIALIGYSALTFLDEPSAAVDAGAKRFLWKIIKNRAEGKAVVVTTHSMEEAEALCDRIAIQVKGQLRCLGTPMHIKSTYGSGYQLEICCNGAQGPESRRPLEEVRNDIISFVESKLSSEAKLMESHADRFLFQLPPKGSGPGASTLGRMFTELNQNKQQLAISDFSVTQPSLEQVFIRFAREQAVTDEFRSEGAS
eukprot:TRINITY_DN29376_c0_g1_i1.p1 TRINITY_DN29376_c0_g1~~TRINITY_DN29376_c0_g1_i1.p1  ORF type:complete len:1346 (-),score=182.74 TRINITY_DN29376_c0_g1_i1:24-4061(-)